MAFRGFGRDSGPSAPPKSQPLFGHVSGPSAPPKSLPLFGHVSVPPPQASPSHHQLQRPTVHRVPRDLDAPEEPPFTSGALKWTRPVIDYTRTAANLNRDSLFPGGDQQSMVEKVSKPVQKRQSEMPSHHPASRTKFKIPRSQELGQPQTFVPVDETLLRSSKSNVMGRLSLSPPKGKSITRMTDAQPVLGPSTSSRDTYAENTVSHVASKRTRSPTSPAGQVFQGKPHIVDDETEREVQAKAKRLTRFKTELSAPIEKTATVFAKNDLPKLEKSRMLGDYSMESIDDVENEHLQATGAIVGLCPDMCPGMPLNLLNFMPLGLSCYFGIQSSTRTSYGLSII